MVSIEPPLLEIPFDEIDENGQLILTRSIKIRNTGDMKTRYSFQLIEKLPQITITQKKCGSIYPGEYDELVVKFKPDSWDIKQMTIFVKESKQSNLLLVKIVAFPALLKFNPPRRLDFGKCILYETKMRTITFSNYLPIEFHFGLQIKDEAPPNYFEIEPLSGILPAKGSVDININFMPLTLVRSQLIMKLTVSQYGFEPIEIVLAGIGDLSIPKLVKSKEPKSTEQNESTSILFQDKNENLPKIVCKKVEFTASADPFTEELSMNLEMVHKSQLQRFVMVGLTAPRKSIAGVLPELQKITKGETDFKIFVPENAVFEPQNSALQQKTGNRLYKILLNSLYTVLYRARADRRIRLLKAYLNGQTILETEESLGPPLKQEPSVPVIQPMSQKIQIFAEKNILPIQSPDIPDLLQPRPIQPKIVPYAEMYELKRIDRQQSQLNFQFKVPSYKSKPELDKTIGSSVDEIEIIPLSTTSSKAPLNPWAGTSTASYVYKPSIEPTDPKFVLCKPFDNHSNQVPLLAAFELDLKKHVHGMMSTYPDTESFLHRK